jgi:glycosyl hydrolase family 12
VGPIGSSTGKVDVAGKSWDLHIGNNGQMKVYSFVAPNPITSFSADLMLFFKYLQSKQNFPVKTQNLLGEFAHDENSPVVKWADKNLQSPRWAPSPLLAARRPSMSPGSLYRSSKLGHALLRPRCRLVILTAWGTYVAGTSIGRETTTFQ